MALCEGIEEDYAPARERRLLAQIWSSFFGKTRKEVEEGGHTSYELERHSDALITAIIFVRHLRHLFSLCLRTLRVNVLLL